MIKIALKIRNSRIFSPEEIFSVAVISLSVKETVVICNPRCFILNSVCFCGRKNNAECRKTLFLYFEFLRRINDGNFNYTEFEFINQDSEKYFQNETE